MVVANRYLFTFGLQKLQMAVTNKYKKRRSCDAFHLKILPQCALFRWTVEIIELRAWKQGKRRLIFCGLNRVESEDYIKDDSFDVVVSTPWREKHFCQQTMTPEMRHPELVVVCVIHIEQRCNPLNPNVYQRSSSFNLPARTMLLQILFKQACCWQLSSSAFIAATLVHCGNNCINDRVPKTSVPGRQRLFFPPKKLIRWSKTAWKDSTWNFG